MTRAVVVDGRWMAACGLGREDVEMPVVRIVGTCGLGRMFEVIRPDQHVWVVAETRCLRVIDHV